MTDYKSAFSENLKSKLEELGKKQAWLAQESGIKPQNISKYMAGNTLPDLATICIIAETLNVSIDSLLGFQPVQKKEPKTLGDAARNIISLSEIPGISLGEAICQETSLSPETGYPETSNVMRYALLFKSGALTKFIEEFLQVKSVCNKIEMGEILFDPWLKNRLEGLDKKITLENIEVAELFDDDGELPF